MRGYRTYDNDEVRFAMTEEQSALIAEYAADILHKNEKIIL